MQIVGRLKRLYRRTFFFKQLKSTSHFSNKNFGIWIVFIIAKKNSILRLRSIIEFDHVLMEPYIDSKTLSLSHV